MAMADGPLQVAVAGGSIGGLCAGLALQRIAGAEVDIYERHVGDVETRGAGIVVQPELTQLLRLVDAAELPTTGCRVRRYLEPDGGEGSEQVMPQRFTSWEAIFQTLRSAFPGGRYHVGAALGAYDTVDRLITAQIAGRGLITADLLVCAKGRSRRPVVRTRPPAAANCGGTDHSGRSASVPGLRRRRPHTRPSSGGACLASDRRSHREYSRRGYDLPSAPRKK